MCNVSRKKECSQHEHTSTQRELTGRGGRIFNEAQPKVIQEERGGPAAALQCSLAAKPKQWGKLRSRALLKPASSKK